MALNKELKQITEADLIELITSRVEERLTLDYKLTLPGISADNDKEFVADVSSFANTAGGDLIYGMSEENGTPVTLVGVEGNPDAEIVRLENRIRTGIAPRIPSVHSHAVKLANSKWALVIRIQKSFIAPHMVTLHGRSKFYARMSNGRYPLDVDQIRLAFLNSESIASKIRQFRLDRIASIRSRETPVIVSAGPVLVLHVLPLNAFDSRFQTSVLALGDDVQSHVTLAPLYNDCADIKRINLDGVLVVRNKDRDGIAWGYTQLYFNGIIESVDAYFLYNPTPEPDFDKTIPSFEFEKGLILAVKRFIGMARSLGIEPPVVLMLTLLDVRNYVLASDDNLRLNQSRPFDRDVLLIPEVIVDNLNVEASNALKPILDSVWNAAGMRGSRHYVNGAWKGAGR